MSIKLQDIPNRKGTQYPHKLCITLSNDAYNKLEALKKIGKDRVQIVRMLLDEFLESVDLDQAG